MEYVCNVKLHLIKHKKTVHNLKTYHQLEVDSVKEQYDQKILETNAKHDRDMASLNRKNREQVNNLISTMKKT